MSATSMRTDFAGVAASQREGAAGGHGVQGIEDEILKSAMEKIGIGVNFRQRFA